MANVTIKDISDYTKISVSTISRALNNPKAVSDKKRQIINEAVEQLGYVPNYFASNLKSKTNHNIGFIVNDVQNPFFNRLIRSIEKNLDTRYRLFINFGLGDDERIDAKIHNFLGNSMSAIMFSPNNYNPDTARLLSRQGVYILQLFTKQYDEFDSIVVDDYYGAYLAARRLLYSGHRRIMLIGFGNAIWQTRVDGFKKAHEDFGLTVEDASLFAMGDKEFITDKICTRLLAFSPTAVITVSDTIGFNTVKAVQKLSLKIPDDISIIQYDDTSWADLLNITAIGHPIDVLGKMIADALIKGLRDGAQHKPVFKKIDPIVLERESIRDRK